VEATWKELQLDIAEYKEEYLKLRSSEDVYSALEDNAVALSTMKSSRFAAAFLAALDKWEKTLSHISETVEALTGARGKGETPLARGQGPSRTRPRHAR